MAADRPAGASARTVEAYRDTFELLLGFAEQRTGKPAFGAYLRGPAGIRHGVGLYVLTLTGDRICAMTRFDTSVLPWFGLPRSLPSR